MCLVNEAAKLRAFLVTIVRHPLNSIDRLVIHPNVSILIEN
jgi:hypothetical protein